MEWKADGSFFGGLWWPVVAAVIVSIKGWSNLSDWLKAHQELAAWVQAIGSIAAILATGWAVHHAHRLQERQRARSEHSEYTQFLEALFQLLGGTARLSWKIRELAVSNVLKEVAIDELKKFQAEFAAFVAALQRVDVTRLDRYELVEAVLVGNAAASRLLDAAETALRNGYISGMTDGADVHEAAEEAYDLLRPRSLKLLEVIDRRGGNVTRDTVPD